MILGFRRREKEFTRHAVQVRLFIIIVTSRVFTQSRNQKHVGRLPTQSVTRGSIIEHSWKPTISLAWSHPRYKYDGYLTLQTRTLTIFLVDICLNNLSIYIVPKPIYIRRSVRSHHGGEASPPPVPPQKRWRSWTCRL